MRVHTDDDSGSLGARPQFIKAAALSRVMRKEYRGILIRTGQHHGTSGAGNLPGNACLTGGLMYEAFLYCREKSASHHSVNLLVFDGNRINIPERCNEHGPSSP